MQGEPPQSQEQVWALQEVSNDADFYGRAALFYFFPHLFVWEGFI